MVRGLIDDGRGLRRARAWCRSGVLAGATLERDVPVDQTLTYDDVELVESALIVRMRRIQESMDAGGEVPDLAALSAMIAG